MSASKLSDFVHVKRSQEAREVELQKAKARLPRQKCYRDIPMFPHGYRRPDKKSISHDESVGGDLKNKHPDVESVGGELTNNHSDDEPDDESVRGELTNDHSNDEPEDESVGGELTNNHSDDEPGDESVRGELTNDHSNVEPEDESVGGELTNDHSNDEPEDDSVGGEVTNDRPEWLPSDKHDYNALPFSNNWLPSNPNTEEILNLYYQLEEHYLKLGALHVDWEEPLTPCTKVAREGAQSGKPPALEVGAVNDDQSGDPTAGGTSSKKTSTKTRHRKPPATEVAEQSAGSSKKTSIKTRHRKPPATEVVRQSSGAAVAGVAQDAQMETPRTKVAGEGAQSGKPPAPEVGGAVNDDQPGDPPAGGTSSKKNSIKTRHRKPPFLKLPSRRVVPGKTPCTTYHESNKQEVEIIRAKQKQEQKEEQKERMDRQRHLKLTLSKQKEVQKQKEKEHKNQQQDQPDLQQDQSVHQTTREPDSFHIIRFRHFGKFVEFLRRNSTGYIVAFRVLENLAEAEHAYWCACRNEYKALKSELSFFTFRKINFSLAYRMVDQVKLGKDTIEKMLDAIFECYPDPEHFDHSSMELYLHTWFVLLGEGPRFEAIRIALFWMLTNYSHEDCPELGLILNYLVHSWSNVCRTAYYLRLMLLEEELALRLIIERPHKTEANKLNSCLNDIFAQFDEHWLMSQERCICLETSRKHIQDKIHLRKEEVGEKFSYGRIAYEQIVREYIPLLVFMERECLPIMMRRDGGYEKIIFPDIVSQEDN